MIILDVIYYASIMLFSMTVLFFSPEEDWDEVEMMVYKVLSFLATFWFVWCGFKLIKLLYLDVITH